MKGKIPPVTDELFDSSPDSGEEYIPQTSEESSDSSLELSEHRNKSPAASFSNSNRNPATPPKSSTRNLATPHCSLSSQIPDSTTFKSEGGESATVVVPAVHKKKDGSRMYGKKQYCLFCMKAFTKIARHLEHRHRNEAEVARAISYPKNSKGRRLQLDHLRNRGNFVHNVTVLKTGEGNLVPRKQPKAEAQGQEFVHCAYCQGLFSRKVLWRHVKICKFKPSDLKPKPGKNRVLSLCAFTAPAPSGVSRDLWTLVNNMTLDTVSLAVKNDWCIIELGQHLYNRLGNNVGKHEYIRQKMRELGRLLLGAKEVTPLMTIK